MSSFPPPGEPTIPQPPAGFDYRGTVQRPRDPFLPKFIAWAVIVACIVFVVWRNVKATKREALAAGSENATAQLQMKMLAQAAVGMKVLSAQAGLATTGPSTTQASHSGADANSQQVLSSLDQLAQSPTEKLRAAIIAGEVLGPDEAVRRIDAMQPISDPDLATDVASLKTIYHNGAGAVDEPAQKLLTDHHGYYARVALAYGVDKNVEPRKSLESSGMRVALSLAAGGFGLIGLTLLSVGLLITAIVLLAVGKIRRAYVPDPVANTSYLEGFAAYVVLFLCFGWVLHHFNLDSLGWEWLGLLIILPVMLLVKLRGGASPPETVAHSFGWYRGRGFLIEVPLGVAGYLAGLPLVALGLLITTRLIKYSHASPTHPIIHMLGGSAWHVVALYGLACVFAPVLEETMFRGALFHHMRRRWGWLISATVVAFIFAVIHPQGWTLVPTLGAIAIVLAALREWRGSLIASMTAHATSNFIVLTIALLLLR